MVVCTEIWENPEQGALGTPKHQDRIRGSSPVIGGSVPCLHVVSDTRVLLLPWSD